MAVQVDRTLGVAPRSSGSAGNANRPSAEKVAALLAQAPLSRPADSLAIAYSPAMLFGGGPTFAATTTINGLPARDWVTTTYVGDIGRAAKALGVSLASGPASGSPSGSAAVAGPGGASVPAGDPLRSSRPLPAPEGAPSASTASPSPPDRTYTVVRGDNLWNIAGRELGDPRRWPEIYDLNKGVIGANPGLIHPGQVYTLPGGGAPARPTPGPGPAPAPAPAPAPVPAGKWAWPTQGRVSSPFGRRTDPIKGGDDFHTGLDIAAPSGSPIRTPLAGRVIFAGARGGYGNYVIIDHGNGLQTAYAHQSQTLVSAGQQVGPGQEIGKVGSTGYSTGPHLHFEVKRNGQFVDPRPFLG
jgi:LysM repeat protein